MSEAPPGDADLALLAALDSAPGEPVEMERLCRTLSLSRPELEAAVDRLRARGCVIQAAHPHGSSGYRLVETPDRLFAHALRRRLPTRWVGCRIEHHETIGSTNDRARELLFAGAPGGTVILAERQTAGRGRVGRRWHSPAGPGIFLSLVLRPGGPLDSVALLQATTAVAVAHGVMRACGLEVLLRWPNDVLIGDRKAAGVLVEAFTPEGGPPAFVVGMGLNVNHGPEDFPPELRAEATSLAMAGKRSFDRREVAATVLTSLEEWYDRMFSGQVDAVARAWRPLSSLLEREVRILRGGRSVTGVVTDLDPIRGVRLRPAGGDESWIPAEHVAFIRAT